MMAAAQPFISGAISKTVNLPNAATVDDISEAYIQAWKLGLKAVAVYRDGCKQSQPLSAAGSKTANSTKDDAARNAAAASHVHMEDDNLEAPPRALRHKLKEERMSITHKFNVGGHEGYIIVGPVSYTHLDVYKRQDASSRSRSPPPAARPRTQPKTMRQETQPPRPMSI